MTQSQVPEVARTYFGPGIHPVIVETFRPLIGWRRYGGHKYVSASWIRKLMRDDVTVVSLARTTTDTRHADFRVRELLR